MSNTGDAWSTVHDELVEWHPSVPPQTAIPASIAACCQGSPQAVVTVHGAWVRAGADTQMLPAAQFSSATTECVPFTLSDAVSVAVPSRETAGRLLLWAVAEGGVVVARTFLDAATVEEPNRRGARLTEQ